MRAAAGIQALAAQKLQVNRATVCKFIRRHPQLQDVINEVTDEITDLSVAGLIENIRNKEMAAIKYWLDNKGQDAGFGLRKNAFEGGDGQMLIPGVLVAPLQPMDPEEWVRMHSPSATTQH